MASWTKPRPQTTGFYPFTRAFGFLYTNLYSFEQADTMPHAQMVEIPLGERRAYSLAEVAGLTGVAISTLYKLMHAGRLKTIKIAGRRLVTDQALDEFLRGE